jgi:2',3'-cyclic-nucleotide 2'-phosphodiesterase (5'-nucleotidase family)
VLNGLTGNVLVLDAGNALFRGTPDGRPTEGDDRRARLLLSTMGALGTKVLAVGHRDLVAGPEFLSAEAKKAGVRPISTNLELNGRAAFSRSVVIEQGGVKVAVLVASPAGPVSGAAGLVGAPVLAALKAELARLPVRDVTMVIDTGGYQGAMALAEALSGSVDLVIQSGEFRGTVPPQRVKDTVLLASGQRGQSLAKLDLTLGRGAGPLLDLNEASREVELLQHLDTQLKSVDERLSLAKDAQAKKGLWALRQEMKMRRDDQAKRVKATDGGRTLKLEWMLLGADIKDDEALKAEVLKVEPTYVGLH